MTDRYESKVIELAAETDYINNDPYGAVLPEDMQRKFDEMKRLAKECQNVKRIRKLEVELSDSQISWITIDLKEKYEPYIIENISRSQAEKIFLNIVYCVIERFEMRVKCSQRSRLISYDMFCKLCGKNRKTLGRKGTVPYTVPIIQEIWLDDIHNTPKKKQEIRKITIDIFNEFIRKFPN